MMRCTDWDFAVRSFPVYWFNIHKSCVMNSMFTLETVRGNYFKFDLQLKGIKLFCLCIWEFCLDTFIKPVKQENVPALRHYCDFKAVLNVNCTSICKLEVSQSKIPFNGQWERLDYSLVYCSMVSSLQIFHVSEFAVKWIFFLLLLTRNI